MKINYINQHKSAYNKMMEDKLNATERSIYMALFMIWNNTNWVKVLSINRQDVMMLAGVGSKVTYTNTLKKLDKLKYLKYTPSYNPLIGSTVEMYNLCNSNEIVMEGLCNGSGNGSEHSSGNGSDTLYKLLNKETIKLLNNNYDLINKNLSLWLKKHKKESSFPSDKKLHQDLKKDFLEYYLDQTGNEFFWTAKEATNLKQLISKLTFSIEEKKEKSSAKKEKATDEEIISSFRIILENLPQWIKEKTFTVAGINSQYMNILNGIKNGQSKQISNEPTDEEIRAKWARILGEE